MTLSMSLSISGQCIVKHPLCLALTELMESSEDFWAKFGRNECSAAIHNNIIIYGKVITYQPVSFR